MAILVTGGAGYIGSHTVRRLRKLGRPVVVLDSLEFGYAHAAGDAPLVVGNIADDRLVASIVAKEDVDSVLSGSQLQIARSHESVDHTRTPRQIEFEPAVRTRIRSSGPSRSSCNPLVVVGREVDQAPVRWCKNRPDVTGVWRPRS
jgi:uncharacterized protein YbjT (DUF2867 family)